MLNDFIIAHREQLIARTRAKVAQRLSPQATEQELTSGVPLFLDQLVETLRLPQPSLATPGRIERSAALHAAALLERGYSVAQVVHDYGDICQAVTELAGEVDAAITTDEFHTLNRCLDNAIAEAVTEYARLRTISAAASETERLGIFAHELRNRISSAQLAFLAIKSGRAPVSGSVATVVTRNLGALTSLVDRALIEVRLDAANTHRQRTALYQLLAEAEVDGLIEADTHGVSFRVIPVDHEIDVNVDPLILAGAIANLVQNALKFTPAGGHVSLETSVVGDRVEIRVTDECGGLPQGAAEELFTAFHQRGTDRRGLGLGLYLARRGMEAHGGTVAVRDIVGRGCVFTINLPLFAAQA